MSAREPVSMISFDFGKTTAKMTFLQCNHVMDVCDKLDIEKYLWFPLLADVPKGVDISSLKLQGLGEEGDSFILNEQKESGEDFGFLCPLKTFTTNSLLKQFHLSN